MTVVPLVTLLAALITQAPAKPSGFSGMWLQDNAKSVLMDVSPRDVQLSVVDSGKSVKVVRRLKSSNPKIPGGWFEAETYTATTDGKPSEQRIPDMHYSRVLVRDGRIWCGVSR